jgi:hypothetical protein
MPTKLPSHVEHAVDSWKGLNKAVKTLTERELEQLFKFEKERGKRYRYLLRIHGRLNKVRADREREEIDALLAR